MAKLRKALNSVSLKIDMFGSTRKYETLCILKDTFKTKTLRGPTLFQRRGVIGFYRSIKTLLSYVWRP